MLPLPALTELSCRPAPNLEVEGWQRGRVTRKTSWGNIAPRVPKGCTEVPVRPSPSRGGCIQSGAPKNVSESYDNKVSRLSLVQWAPQPGVHEFMSIGGLEAEDILPQGLWPRLASQEVT